MTGSRHGGSSSKDKIEFQSRSSHLEEPREDKVQPSPMTESRHKSQSNNSSVLAASHEHQFSDNKRFQDKQDVIIKEIHNNSKSLVTVGDFGEEEKRTHTNGVETGESFRKKTLRSESEEFREQLIRELKGLDTKEDERKEKNLVDQKNAHSTKDEIEAHNRLDRQQRTDEDFKSIGRSKPQIVHSGENSSLPTGMQASPTQNGMFLKNN